MNDFDLLTEQHVAKILCLSTSYLQKARSPRTEPMAEICAPKHTKHGHSVLYKESEIIAFVESLPLSGLKELTDSQNKESADKTEVPQDLKTLLGELIAFSE